MTPDPYERFPPPPKLSADVWRCGIWEHPNARVEPTERQRQRPPTERDDMTNRRWDLVAWGVLLTASLAIGMVMTGCGGQVDSPPVEPSEESWCCVDSVATCGMSDHVAFEWQRYRELSGREGECYLVGAQ